MQPFASPHSPGADDDSDREESGQSASQPPQAAIPEMKEQSNPGVPVEERLQRYLSKYKNKRAELAREAEVVEQEEVKNPQINEISELIVANMEVKSFSSHPHI